MSSLVTRFNHLLLFSFNLSCITSSLLSSDSEEYFLIGPNGFLVIFYGLYFGILGRDSSEICTDRIASTIGVSLVSL